MIGKHTEFRQQQRRRGTRQKREICDPPAPTRGFIDMVCCARTRRPAGVCWPPTQVSRTLGKNKKLGQHLAADIQIIKSVFRFWLGAGGVRDVCDASTHRSREIPRPGGSPEAMVHVGLGVGPAHHSATNLRRRHEEGREQRTKVSVGRKNENNYRCQQSRCSFLRQHRLFSKKKLEVVQVEGQEGTADITGRVEWTTRSA